MAKYFRDLSAERGLHMGLLRSKSKSTSELILELQKDPAIQTVEPNYLRHISSQTPTDPGFNQLWALNNTGQIVNGTAGNMGADIKFVPAWNLAQAATNQVVVAVIDTGVDYNHPDLAANICLNPSEIAANGVDDDANGYVDDIRGWNFADNNNDPSDSGEHGTHVAGTIAAVGNNALGVIGVCYKARILALKASSDGENLDDAAIIEAIQYAVARKKAGANVVAINASFGGPGFDSAMQAAIQSAGNVGILFCAAAGNDGANNDSVMTYPADYRLTNMIVVAATDSRDNLASFSNFGAANVDLGAPGVSIYSTKPTNAPGTTASVQIASSNYAANALTFSPTTSGVGIAGLIIDCGLGSPSDFTASVRGNIALISRGTLKFADKVSNAMVAGAKAVVIYNNVSGGFSGTLLNASNWIPTIALSQADGLAIKGLVPAAGVVVNVTDPTKVYQFLDGTSMATPHVCGAVAFAAMNFPNESFAQRKLRILNNVEPIPSLQGKVVTGGRLNLQRIVDSDLNGLPDWWEQTQFGHLLGSGANADADNDGASNLAERIAGTNPNDRNSNLRLGLRSTVLPGVSVLSWRSALGKTYRIESTTNLSSGWPLILRSNIVATPPLNTETNLGLPLSSQFYRVMVEQ